jgi:hypothetical protein
MVNANHTVFMLVSYNFLRNHSLTVNAVIFFLKKGLKNADIIFCTKKQKQMNEVIFDFNKPIFDMAKKKKGKAIPVTGGEGP